MIWVILVLIIIALIVAVLLINNSESSPPPTTSGFSIPTFVVSADPTQLATVETQLQQAGFTNYRQWAVKSNLPVSHRRLWQHIVRKKLDWCLILEETAHLHPQFVQLFPHYWNYTPPEAIIVYPSHTDPHTPTSSHTSNSAPVLNKVIPQATPTSHAYLINHVSAQYLLDHIDPNSQNPLDQCIYDHFSTHPGSYVFNDQIMIGGLKPENYRLRHQFTHRGIIY